MTNRTTMDTAAGATSRAADMPSRDIGPRPRPACIDAALLITAIVYHERLAGRHPSTGWPCRGVRVPGLEMPMSPRISRRNMLALGAGSMLGAPLLGAPLVRPARSQTRTVYVNSYGGVWESSWKKAFFDPFTAQTGIQVRPVPGVSFAKLKAQVQSRNFDWDVINLGDVEYAQAVLEGLLEKVDKSAAKTDQLPPQIVRDYGITSYSLGTNIVYRKDKFPNGGPQSWADFWDVKRFPGPRCMYDRSFTCLAFALLADGVPADKLYPMIMTQT